MCDQNIKALKANSIEFLELVDRLAERTIDGVIIVDDKYKIRLVNPTIVHDFRSKYKGKMPGKDYFKVMFGLDLKNPKDKERAENTPLYKAFRKGEVTRKPPYPTVVASNNLAYQVETRIANVTVNGSQKRTTLEFWRRMGEPKVFQKDPSFIEI